MYLLNLGLIQHVNFKKLNLPLGCSPTHSPVHSRSRAARMSCSDDTSHHWQPVENTARKRKLINHKCHSWDHPILHIPEWPLWYYEDIC